MSKRQKRQYSNDYPSVTTILGVLNKPELIWWFKSNTPQFIEEESSKAKEIGTTIHEVIQDYIETGKAKVDTSYAQEVTNALQSFVAFTKDHPEIKLKRSEVQLTSRKHKFNGTMDCLAEKDGQLILADWKTGKAGEKEKPSIYDEYLTQVSAYVHLYNEVHATNIDQAIIVSVAKDKVAYNTLTLDGKLIKKCFANIFLPALKIYKFQRKLKRKE